MTKGAQDMNPLNNLQFEKGDTPPEVVPYNKVDTYVDGKHVAKVLRNAINNSDYDYGKLVSSILSIADLLDVE